jgi:hypothetical protein
MNMEQKELKKVLEELKISEDDPTLRTLFNGSIAWVCKHGVEHIIFLSGVSRTDQPSAYFHNPCDNCCKKPEKAVPSSIFSGSDKPERPSPTPRWSWTFKMPDDAKR